MATAINENCNSNITNSDSSEKSDSSFGFIIIPKTCTSILNYEQAEKFHQRIQQEYDTIWDSEQYHCCYIYDSNVIAKACEYLRTADEGTFFIRPARGGERISNVEYFVQFVVNKKIFNKAICSDKNHEEFWFLSKSNHDMEIIQTYAGIDLLINRKQIYQYSEPQNGFQICFNQPIDRSANMCIPLPDEVCALAGQNTILHELATQGLTQYFNELIRISSDDLHPLNEHTKFIVNKINGRNKQGQTPLILAIQAKKYKFIDILLDNGVNVNIIDTQGCSPLHYACQQANSELLQKLIVRGANPHYLNRKQTADGQSNLSAFHYLAMAREATTQEIKRCTVYLIEHGCPLMPLTSDEQSPFDIARIYNNNAYKCVQIFCRIHDFNDINPIEVSSRNEAKTILSDLVTPSMLGKLRLRIKQYENRDCYEMDGLFLYYRVRKPRGVSDGESGLCVYYAGKSNPPKQILYSYSLITSARGKVQPQVMLFRSIGELINSHTKCKGILPTLLRNFVQYQNGEIIITKATTLTLSNERVNSLIEEEEPIDTNRDINVNLIDHFDISQISSIKLLNENHRRLILLGQLRLDSTTSISIIIKDYLPSKDIDSYKQYRLKEFHPTSRHQSYTTDGQSLYEFSSRTRLEYKHESKFLLKELQNHPFIVHTFICNHNLRKDYRIFMEYLPLGNLHSRLTRLDQTSLEPLNNAFHWIYQLAQVMAYLAKKNDTHIKLSDFGLSRLEGFSSEGKDCILPPRWTAPECFDPRHKAVLSSDVWSFGVVIWEIYSFGALPYEAETKGSLHQLIPFLKRYLIEQGRRLSRPDRCSEGMYDLMYRCWNLNNDKRPCFVDIINELNGMDGGKYCTTPFTHDETNEWKNVKKEYLDIFQTFLPLPLIVVSMWTLTISPLRTIMNLLR